MKNKNRVVLITGGVSGLGAATAALLKHEDYRVVIIDQVDVSNTDDMDYYKVDITSPDAMESAVSSMRDKYKMIHAVINCAGVCPAGRVVGRTGAMPLSEFNAAIQVNLVGTFNVNRLVAEWMINTLGDSDDPGVIINTASIAATDGQLGQVAYSASKAGVLGLTLPMARELAQYGIRVVAISPGVMDTPMMSSMKPAAVKAIESTVLCPKRLGLPSEFAQLVKTILNNKYINATNIRLDGGLRMV